MTVGGLDDGAGGGEVVVSTVPVAAQTPELGAALSTTCPSSSRCSTTRGRRRWPPRPLASGRVLVSGLDLLVHQAVLQVELFTGRDGPLAAMRAAGQAGARGPVGRLMDDVVLVGGHRAPVACGAGLGYLVPAGRRAACPSRARDSRRARPAKSERQRDAPRRGPQGALRRRRRRCPWFAPDRAGLGARGVLVVIGSGFGWSLAAGRAVPLVPVGVAARASSTCAPGCCRARWCCPRRRAALVAALVLLAGRRRRRTTCVRALVGDGRRASSSTSCCGSSTRRAGATATSGWPALLGCCSAYLGLGASSSSACTRRSCSSGCPAWCSPLVRRDRRPAARPTSRSGRSCWPGALHRPRAGATVLGRSRRRVTGPGRAGPGGRLAPCCAG